jgi:hypothetical protein
LILGFDGELFSIEWRDALWAMFLTAAPQRRRHPSSDTASSAEPEEPFATLRHQPEDCREVEEARLRLNKKRSTSSEYSPGLLLALAALAIKIVQRWLKIFPAPRLSSGRSSLEMVVALRCR